MPDLKILLIEDDWSVRSAVAGYLRQRGFIVAEADSLASALNASQYYQADTAVIDIVLPEKTGGMADFARHTGVEIARRLRQVDPTIGIVFLSAYFDRGPQVLEMFIEGHEGIAFLLKGSRPQELYEAIIHVSGGRSGLEMSAGVQRQSNSAAAQALEALSEVEKPVVRNALACIINLSPPERRVFDLIGACYTRQEAAALLNLSPKTVNSHMEAVYTCLELNKLPVGMNPLALLAKIHLLYSLKMEVRGSPSSASDKRP